MSFFFFLPSCCYWGKNANKTTQDNVPHTQGKYIICSSFISAEKGELSVSNSPARHLSCRKEQHKEQPDMPALPKTFQSRSSVLLAFKMLKASVSSVAPSCPTLCDPMNRSTTALPVHHQLPESIQTHVHRVDDAIQPSHKLKAYPHHLLASLWLLVGKKCIFSYESVPAYSFQNILQNS